MISLNCITKSLARKTIFDDVSLTIETGTHVAITGPSGCGKTTFLRLIAGLDTPDRGDIRIESKLTSQSGRTLVPPHQRQVGFVFQASALWPHMNVVQNILFGLQQLPKSDAAEHLNRILSETGTTHLAKRMPGTLSGGEQRRVAVARTLAPEPRILLMDEPLTDLDSVAKTELAELIKSIVQNSKMTLIFVTHDLKEVSHFCDRNYVIKGAKVIALNG
ncbi:ABC transporter ATP-binding protein [Pseudohalocynthiibacter aestuariivivens]|jgi:iron(III) transport system ATP-binding protein|uniref:ABC transporter ATP-binding protein n=1 Tax=Pseudohalocynthiibacter aestuariivivens TaxID=1591409 RepID=A0ABV5JGX7_9RHOB|nr:MULTISPECIES: ATP-binding cassette domain-containing protein [Pseudohalocynthiibacter]MBS9718199.1 ATP-binding cassette domain-containing protein [Pseudohalocynthiibacter aestuariivivens]MCK0103847.1 ATP-binding cassette domain-containing protein [Pseudohalocynthiibacter sp. F2068]